MTNKEEEYWILDSIYGAPENKYISSGVYDKEIQEAHLLLKYRSKLTFVKLNMQLINSTSFYSISPSINEEFWYSGGQMKIYNNKTYSLLKWNKSSFIFVYNREDLFVFSFQITERNKHTIYLGQSKIYYSIQKNSKSQKLQKLSFHSINAIENIQLSEDLPNITLQQINYLQKDIYQYSIIEHLVIPEDIMVNSDYHLRVSELLHK